MYLNSAIPAIIIRNRSEYFVKKVSEFLNKPLINDGRTTYGQMLGNSITLVAISNILIYRNSGSISLTLIVIQIVLLVASSYFCSWIERAIRKKRNPS